MKKKADILAGTTKEVVTSKFVDRNTLKVSYKDGSEAIRLHNTDVVTFLPNGKIELNSGGWRTATTKERINKFSPARLHQDKGVWYVSGSIFYDGMLIDKDGKLVSKKKEANIKKIDKIKTDIKKFVDLITEDNLPIPSGGDCWLCCLVDEKGLTWGDQRPDNHDHLHQHIKEKYLHGSLLVNAMREAGYRDEQIGFHYHLKLADTFKRSLRKYLQKRLIKDISVK